MSENEGGDINQIQQLITNGYMDAVHSNDPAAYAALYTKDATWMPPGIPPVHGRNAIEEAERNVFAAASLKIVSKATEISVQGDFGWVVGEIDGVRTPHDGSGDTPFYFRLLWLVFKEDGEWKIHRQIWHVRHKD